jgi:3-dehydroquinate dehydratase-2
MRPIILVLNGPNLDMLGRREPEVYGRGTLLDLKAICDAKGTALGVDIDFRQSNFEGDLIQSCHDACHKAAGIVINPAALGFTSLALVEALKIFDGPVVEVHLSNTHARGSSFHHSLVSTIATGVITGLGTDGYECALDCIDRNLKRKAS